jgi:hypothetical protein
VGAEAGPFRNFGTAFFASQNRNPLVKSARNLTADGLIGKEKQTGCVYGTGFGLIAFGLWKKQTCGPGTFLVEENQTR